MSKAKKCTLSVKRRDERGEEKKEDTEDEKGIERKRNKNIMKRERKQ